MPRRGQSPRPRSGTKPAISSSQHRSQAGRRRLPGRLARVTGCTGLLTGLAVLVGALLFPGLAAFIAASVISALSLKFGQRNVRPSPNDHYARRRPVGDLDPEQYRSIDSSLFVVSRALGKVAASPPLFLWVPRRVRGRPSGVKGAAHRAARDGLRPPVDTGASTAPGAGRAGRPRPAPGGARRAALLRGTGGPGLGGYRSPGPAGAARVRGLGAGGLRA